MDLMFFLNSILFGIGLAMDAFSVSLANGLREPEMPQRRMCMIAGTFCLFQILMPLIGWFCVHTIAETFRSIQKYIPWTALFLLLCLGGNMLREGIRDRRERKDAAISPCDKDLDGEEANPGTQTVVSAGKPENKESPAKGRVGFAGLMIQGIATSIDALSVGFTISEYHFAMALTEALIIGAVTFIICMIGVKLGRQFGTRLAGKATILGGAILIFIGIEIFLKGVL